MDGLVSIASEGVVGVSETLSIMGDQSLSKSGAADVRSLGVGCLSFVEDYLGTHVLHGNRSI